METLYQIMGILAAGLILFILVRTIKGRPELFSKESMSRSFLTMGMLGIGLIGFVALLILLLNN